MFFSASAISSESETAPPEFSAAGTAKTDSILNYREELRIRLIEDYLKSKDTLSQIKILIPDREAIKNVGSSPVFEVKFSIDE